jgi:hypothetical protein
MSQALKISIEPEPRRLYIVPNDVDKLLRDYVEGRARAEPREELERRGLRSAIDNCIKAIEAMRDESRETTRELRNEIKGVSARVSLLEGQKPAPYSIPPVTSFAKKDPENSSVYNIPKADVEALQREINKANAAAAWTSVRGGAGYVLRGVALVLAIAVVGLLGRALLFQQERAPVHLAHPEP